MKFPVIAIFSAVVGLAQANIKSIDADDACLRCPDTCTLLPPNNFPCYQGTPKNANFCFNTVSLRRKYVYMSMSMERTKWFQDANGVKLRR